MLLLTGTAALASCAGNDGGGGFSLGTPGVESRLEHAQTLAAGANLTRNDIQTGGYTLASWQRVHNPAQPINVYIEGDGLAWISRSSPSNNPTPTEPVALELAAMDPSPNVVYLARPCQYTALSQSSSCSRRSWMAGRFDEDVINAMNAALTAAATPAGHGPAQADINLIGFSGGGNIAALLAQRRSDVKSLRTVAGNLDPAALNTLHKVSPMPTALNAADKAALTAALPQMHFIGAQDDIVKPEVFASYAAGAPGSPCIGSKIVPGVSHARGWKALWPSLLAKPLPCAK